MGKSDNIILSAGEGRKYHCGKMTSFFKADEAETDEKYSVSEWRIEPHSEGPGAHLHEENDEIFFVLEGNADFLLSTPTFISIGLMVLSLLFVMGALTSGIILFRSRKVKSISWSIISYLSFQSCILLHPFFWYILSLFL